MQHEDNNDPVWDLLNKASDQKAGPMFSRDVMRSIRLEEQDASSWWSKLLRPTPVLGTLATAAACVALVLFAPDSSSPEVEALANSESFSTEQGFAALTEMVTADDELSDLIDPLSLVASNDAELLSDFEMLMEL